MASLLYRNAIVDAIAELKERKGSSMIAIQKVIKGKHPDRTWHLTAFHKALKVGIQGGYFIRIKVRRLVYLLCQ
jgi:linker histone H1 and H5 family